MKKRYLVKIKQLAHQVKLSLLCDPGGALGAGWIHDDLEEIVRLSKLVFTNWGRRMVKLFFNYLHMLASQIFTQSRKSINCKLLIFLSVVASGCATVDSDGDGVRDSRDACLMTPSIASVDNKGCAVDNDLDRVVDYMDDCPDTEAGVTVDKNGCASDNNDKVVSNKEDHCTDTPVGPDSNGCAVVGDGDADADGVIDRLDQCPDTPIAGVPGLAADKKNETSPSYHLVKKGDTLYSLSARYGLDYKLIAEDNNIESPYTLSIGQKVLIKTVEPVVRDSAVEMAVDSRGCYVIFSLRSASFSLDNIVLTPAARLILDKVAGRLKASSQLKVWIAEHTDSVGDADYNQQLSEQRADSAQQRPILVVG